MKIDPRQFVAFSMSEADKQALVNNYANESGGDEADRILRRNYAKVYITPTDKNYLFTKSALKLIDSIKIKDNPELRQMVINAAEDKATYLLDSQSFVRYYRNPLSDGIAGIYYWIDGPMQFYEAFHVLPDGINHPKYLLGESVPQIDRFLKMMIFVKCTNTEAIWLDHKGGGQMRRARVDGEKYVNEADVPVTLVNARYNKIVIRDEPFYVNTHGRFQPYGEKSKKIKYIIIEGYYKKGYKREYV